MAEERMKHAGVSVNLRLRYPSVSLRISLPIDVVTGLTNWSTNRYTIAWRCILIAISWRVTCQVGRAVKGLSTLRLVSNRWHMAPSARDEIGASNGVPSDVSTSHSLPIVHSIHFASFLLPCFHWHQCNQSVCGPTALILPKHLLVSIYSSRRSTQTSCPFRHPNTLTFLPFFSLRPAGHSLHRSLPHTSSIFPSVPSPRWCAAITRYKRHHIPPLPPLPSSSPSCRFFYQTDAASGSDMMRLIRGEGCLIGMPNGDWKVRCDPLSFTWFQCVMGSMGAAVDSSTESLRQVRNERRCRKSLKFKKVILETSFSPISRSITCPATYHIQFICYNYENWVRK